MQAIAKNYSPEVKRWAARLHRRRGPGLRLWRCPWLAWTQAIQDRFARSWMPGRGNEQTLLQRTSLLMRHYQQPAPQVQVGWQTSITAGWPGHDRTLLIPLPPAPPERLILMQTLLSREHYFQSSSILRTGLLRNSMQNLMREVNRHTLATLRVEQAAAPGAKSWLQADAATAGRKAGASDPEPLPLVKRLLMQNRRLEEQMVPPQTVLLERSAPPARETHFPESAPSPVARSLGINAPWTPNPMQPGLNINQITDEVVRQLDSRLIAARERFGKI